MTVSLVARQHGVAASQLFFVRREQYQKGSITAVAAGKEVVPASELVSAMKQIKALQRLLGNKTMKNELLKEALIVLPAVLSKVAVPPVTPSVCSCLKQ